ncbi:hypothetical protein KCP70_11845 [Salmonella enterica subsp. enterica]|nr:hypothetical protein KCP70_11845 [Salmonella enterica subsp. enterica]
MRELVTTHSPSGRILYSALARAGTYWRRLRQSRGHFNGFHHHLTRQHTLGQ